MGDSGLRMMLEEIEASIEAGFERAEETAADDLALSLLQDTCVRDRLTRCGGFVTLDGTRSRITHVGADFLGVDRSQPALVPATHSVILLSPTLPPAEEVRSSFAEVLRSRARSRAIVRISTPESWVSGRLIRSGRDYVSVVGTVGEQLVPLDGIRSVSFARGGSVDGP